MTERDIQTQTEYAAKIMESWPAWKRNILQHSTEPTNKMARPPIIRDKD